MQVQITPAPLGGTVPAIASKSDAHRILICAALADGPTLVSLRSMSQDIAATMDCLRALGAQIDQQPDGRWFVTPIAAPTQGATLDCGESGSTLRFVLPLAAALGAQSTLVGHGRLPQRPMGDLLEQLGCHGIQFSAPALPFALDGTLQGGQFFLPGHVSSQFVTGLLLCAPLLPGGCTITLTSPMESAAYVDITTAAMARFGVNVHSLADGWQVPAGQHYHSPGALEAEGDWSNAAFWLCAGALGAPVTVTGLNPDSPQGDRAIVQVLQRMGATLTWQGDALTAAPGPLTGCQIDGTEIPDLIPVLAMVAACGSGTTEFTRVARLRLKESDRLAAITKTLAALGGSAQEGAESLLVQGTPLAGGQADSFADHRMAMAAAIAAIRCQGPVCITGAQAADKSYPDFWRHYESLGGKIHVVTAG